jgi:hypothetical protein
MRRALAPLDAAADDVVGRCGHRASLARREIPATPILSTGVHKTLTANSAAGSRGGPRRYRCRLLLTAAVARWIALAQPGVSFGFLPLAAFAAALPASFSTCFA